MRVACYGKKYHSANQSQTFSNYLASLWENFWLSSAQKFSNYFYAHGFAALKI